MDRLKQKWGIESSFQFWVIMVMFSLAGMSVVRLKIFLYPYIGIGAATPLWIKVVAWPIVVIPCYYLLLMFWGTVLGQRRFAWWFTSKTMRRMKLLPPIEEPTSEAEKQTEPQA